MKYEEVDFETATPVKSLAALGLKLPMFRKAEDADYKAKDVRVPAALMGDDFLSGF